jgi:predicted glycoside hydrolase/deacetylase ChbG (UPF0249 family)
MLADTAMPRLLIVNADDLGLHEDLNRGIYLAHTEGIVTSASVVACGEAFDHASTIIQECGELDVGVHLTLIEERPLCPATEIPSLVGPDGRFLPSYRHLAARILMGAVSRAEVRRELRAQIERVIAAGCRPSHLDGHQHVHMLPPVWHVTRELAGEFGIRWIRVPHFRSLFRSPKSLFDPFFRLGLNILSATTTSLTSRAEPRIRTAGLHLTGRLGEGDLLRIVAALRPGISEIVTHPGIKTPALAARYHWNYEFSMELAALTAPQIIAVLRSNGVKLTRFSEC